MSSISSDIAQLILDMMEETGHAEIQRNLLAQTLGCVPSQINYVIASRFSPEHGFLVESRRGGGGYVRIRRVSTERGAVLPALVNAIGGHIDDATLRAHISNLYGQEFMSGEAAALMRAAASDSALRELQFGLVRDTVRAAIFKQMLLTLNQQYKANIA